MHFKRSQNIRNLSAVQIYLSLIANGENFYAITLIEITINIKCYASKRYAKLECFLSDIYYHMHVKPVRARVDYSLTFKVLLWPTLALTGSFTLN